MRTLTKAVESSYNLLASIGEQLGTLPLPDPPCSSLPPPRPLTLVRLSLNRLVISSSDSHRSISSLAFLPLDAADPPVLASLSVTARPRISTSRVETETAMLLVTSVMSRKSWSVLDAPYGIGPGWPLVGVTDRTAAERGTASSLPLSGPSTDGAGKLGGGPNGEGGM